MQNVNATVESLREEHLRVRQVLEHAEIMADVLTKAAPSRQRNGMQMIGAMLDDCVRAHDEWEERALGPAESRGEGHEVLVRWIGGLIREGSARMPDLRAFHTRLERVIGVVIAHLEEEQQTALPLAQ
jgi:hypothetical protein